MKRGGPLKRRRAKSNRARSKYRQRVRFTPWMMAVKKLPCAARLIAGHVCDGETEADHAGPRGVGQKAHDATTIPMCMLGHRQRTDFSGPFRSWTHGQMHNFLVGRVLNTQKYLVARGVTLPQMTVTELQEFTRWLELRGEHVDKRANSCPPASWDVQLREDGNIDVRYPDAAPLPVALVVSEGKL